MIAPYDFEAIRDDFAQASVSIFPEALFSFFSGSVAYGGGKLGKSDIDFAVVLENDKDVTLPTCLSYARYHATLSRKHGFEVDESFLGEVLTSQQIEDALAGRGFSVKDNNIYLPQASNEYYLSDSEHWYRAWLSMAAFSVYCSGDRKKFEKTKKRAWKTVLLFTIDKSGWTSFSADTIISFLMGESNKWLGFGVTDNYFFFPEFERPYIEKALQELQSEGYLSQPTQVYAPITETIISWERNLARQIKNESIRNASFPLGMSEIASISATLKREGII